MNTQAKYDALIATAMRAKAMRADPNFSYGGVSILEAVQELFGIDDLSDTIADMRHDLELHHGREFEGRDTAQERADYRSVA